MPSMNHIDELYNLYRHDETALIMALQNKQENAFMFLVDEYGAVLYRLAYTYVQQEQIAEDVVQETLIAVLKGIKRFERRSSLKTWLFRILVNRAKTHAAQTQRYIPLADELSTDEFSTVISSDQFNPADHPYAGHWAVPQANWSIIPEEKLLADEVQAIINRTLEQLPFRQAQVVHLHDVFEWSTEEICDLLNISATNCRVLLHRGRSIIRQALDDYFKGHSL